MSVVNAARRALPWALLVFSLYTVSTDLRASLRIHLLRRRPDRVTRMVRALEQARRYLPARGEVGYVGARDARPQDRALRYYLTQYALAPLIVVPSTRARVVVGNFVEAAPAGAAVRLKLLRDLGGGVMLFQGQSP